jgi:hypothetical protein
MSKHKVTRYDEGGDVEEEANKGENLDTEAGPKTMPSRPVSRTPASEPSRMSGPGRKPTPPAPYSNEGKGDSKYRKQTMTPESQAIERVYPEQMLTPGVGVKTMASAAQNLARTGAKEAPEVVSAARGALDRAMSVERASPKTGDMAKINDALKAFKNKPAAKAAPKPKAKRDDIGRADTLDENGAAMKRGGSVKKYASGGFTRSADGCAERGKTRAQQFCGGGMSKGRK